VDPCLFGKMQHLMNLAEQHNIFSLCCREQISKRPSRHAEWSLDALPPALLDWQLLRRIGPQARIGTKDTFFETPFFDVL
jgi:hypothetical protein